MAFLQTFALLVVMCFLGQQTDAKKDRAEYKLREMLKSDMDPEIRADMRPVEKHTDAVSLQFGLALISILAVDTDVGSVTGLFWMKHMWNDVTMRWNPDDYDGISKLNVRPTEIWTPDMTLYTSLDDNMGKIEKMLVVAMSDGSVIHIPPVKLTVPCSPNPDEKDVLDCTIKIGSWTYDANHVDISFFEGLEDLDVAEYIPSESWEITHHSAKKVTKRYDCCPEPYSHMEFTLGVRVHSRGTCGN